MRVELKGEGDSIPIIALPDPNLSSDVPPQSFLLETGEFLKADYVSLGYTNYEVMCIGAAGGKGGDVPHYVNWSHGGGGGGGGLHHVGGLLADLPDVVPVVVGQPGADGIDGNNSTIYTPAHSKGLPDEDFPNEDLSIVDTGERPLMRGGHTYITAAGVMVPPYVMVNNYTGEVVPPYPAVVPDRIPYVLYPNIVASPFGPAYVAPQDGGDGGHSAFGAVCKASGGKGGKKSLIFVLYNTQYGGLQNIPGGDGGDGGVGNSDIPGGGAAGGKTILTYDPAHPGKVTGISLVLPEDGGWNGVIGEGGGGGRGGTLYQNPIITAGHTDPPVIHPAGNGGQGSFNFGDPSVFGPKQNRQNDLGKPIVPGAGGGARVGPALIFGGRSVGAKPEGAVWIRLTRVEL